MMVGTPGSGKSYSAIELCVIPALSLGRPVRTNIPLRVEAIRKRWPDADVGQINPREPDCWGTIPGGALVVIDEIGALWPSGQKVLEGGAAVEWLAMHRHRVGEVRGKPVSTDVVMISQGSTDLAGWARSKVDRTYILRKLDAVGAERRYRCDWYQGWVDSRKPPASLKISGGIGSYKPEVYELYQSHTKGDAGVEAVGVAELRADGKRTVWGSGWVRMAVAGLFAVAVLGWYVVDRGGSFFVPSGEASAAKAETSRGSPKGGHGNLKAETSTGAEGGERASPPGASVAGEWSSWRLAAWIGPRADGSYAIVAQDGKRRRTLERVECGMFGAGEWGCRVEGEWATEATGSALDLSQVVDPEGGGPKEVDYVALARKRMDAGIPIGEHGELVGSSRMRP